MGKLDWMSKIRGPKNMLPILRERAKVEPKKIPDFL
jgi:hypothetical protein